MSDNSDLNNNKMPENKTAEQETSQAVNPNTVFNRNLNEETIHTDASASTLAEFLIHQEEYVKKQKEKKSWIGEKEEEYKKLFEKIKTYIKDPKSLDAIEEAYELAAKAHAEQVRATGEPYIIHPLSVAYILAELEMDAQGIIAALLHDVVEDTEYTLEDIKMMFGDEVAFLVDGVTKLSQFHYKDKEDQQLENFRKMFLAMAKDIRVVVIKLLTAFITCVPWGYSAGKNRKGSPRKHWKYMPRLPTDSVFIISNGNWKTCVSIIYIRKNTMTSSGR